MVCKSFDGFVAGCAAARIEKKLIAKETPERVKTPSFKSNPRSLFPCADTPDANSLDRYVCLSAAAVVLFVVP